MLQILSTIRLPHVLHMKLLLNGGAMNTAICFIILCPEELETLYRMQKVVSGWQEYYEAIFHENLCQAFIAGQCSVEIDDFKERERGFRIEFDQSWVCQSVENIGILIAAYEQIKEFIDEHYLPPVIHLVIKDETVLHSFVFKQSRIFKMFADLGIEQLHIDVMNESKVMEDNLDTMGEVGKEDGEWKQEEWVFFHEYFRRRSK